MIRHYDDDGRQVYTVTEAAVLRGYKHPESMRTWMRRRREDGIVIEPAGVIAGNEPVYYPEDLGLGD